MRVRIAHGGPPASRPAPRGNAPLRDRRALCSAEEGAHEPGGYAEPRVYLCGDTGVSVEFGAEIDLSINRKVRRLYKRLRSGAHPGIIDMGPSYCSLFIRYDPWICSLEKLLCIIEENLEAARSRDGAEEGPERIVEVPVCYGGQFGPDIEEVANLHGIGAGEVAALHAAPLYHVYMIGFIVGFPYLGGLDERLHTPRKKSPGRSVPAGSVGIADRQTGIYPVVSPGGWWIVGMTPLKVFDLLREEPFLFEAGDGVRFTQITREEFESYKDH